MSKEVDVTNDVIPLYHISRSILNIGDPIMPYAFKDNTFNHNIDLFIDFLETTPGKVVNYIFKTMESNKPGKSPHSEAFVEAIFEFIRKYEFSSKPSRLNSRFFFDNPIFCVGLWKRYKEKPDNRNPGHIYRCEIENSTAIIHTGDMRLLRNNLDISLPVHDNLQKMYSLARDYWRGDKQMEWPEILVEGRVVVVEVLPPECFDEIYPQLTFNSVHDLEK